MAGGMTLLAVMLIFLPPLQAIPLHGAIQLASNFSRTVIQREHARYDLLWRYGLPLLPMGALGLLVASRLHETIEGPMRRGGIADDGERIEVAMIGGRGHGGIARQKGHAFRQGVPPESPPPATPGAATDFEFVRIVDDGLDAQHAAVLVVHLDPVPFIQCFTRAPGQRRFQSFMISPAKPHGACAPGGFTRWAKRSSTAGQSRGAKRSARRCTRPGSSSQRNALSRRR